MSDEVELKSIPSVRVAELSAPCASYDGPDIGPALSPLYPTLTERMERAGVAMTGPPMAYYLPASDDPDDAAITVHAAFPIGEAPAGDIGFDVVELPAITTAATKVHYGPMAEAYRTGGALKQWITENGYRPVGRGFAREIYLDCPMDDHSKWVTELQVEVAR